MQQTTETHYKVLKQLEAKPKITQRELAREIGISLGKINYCVKALIQKGWLKANNFKNNKNKSAYAYLLTPQGIEKKAQITVRYLRSKITEFDTLKAEITQLETEVNEGPIND